VPRADNKGRVLAAEIMIATAAVRSLIREDKIHQLMSMIQTGGKFGMRTMNQALHDIYTQHLITYDEALAHSMDVDDLKRLFQKA
jgi:twitching motility protein PilT